MSLERTGTPSDGCRCDSKRYSGWKIAAPLALVCATISPADASDELTQDDAIRAALNELCPVVFDAPPLPQGLGPNLERYCTFRTVFGLVVPGEPGGDTGSATSHQSELRQARGGEILLDEEVQADWRFFLTASRADERKRETRFEPGHDLDIRGLGLGLERRIGQHHLGLVIATEDHEGDYRNSGGGRLQVDAQLLQLYLDGEWAGSIWYNASLRRGWHEFDTLRRLRFEDTEAFFAFHGVDALVPSRGDMREWAAQVAVGRDWDLGKGVGLGLSTGLDYSRRSFDAFAESGDVPLRLAYAERREFSTLARVALELRRAYSTSHGVYLPRVGLGWQYEFRDDATTIQARFAEDLRDNPTAVAYATDPPDRSSGHAEIGLAWFGSGGWSAHLGYRHQLAYRDYDRDGVAMFLGREF